jgi:uncharacterized membrane-anchored protein YhcB (DUF1043 family)
MKALTHTRVSSEYLSNTCNGGSRVPRSKAEMSEVQRAVSLLFELFELYGSALAVLRHFYARGLKYPARVIGGEHKGEIRWSPIEHSRVLQELHNPLYSGAYVYGRIQYKRVWRDDNGTLTYSSVQIKRKESLVVRRDNHEGYITWGQHLGIEQRLSDNTYRFNKGNRGAARTGAALLQGLVWCGKCGARMQVFYGNVRSYGYTCDRDSVRFGERRCQSIPGFYIDAAVKEKVLLAAAPAQLEMSIRALDRLDSVSAEASRQKKTALDRARREAEMTQGHLLRVEPELALAAGKLRKSLNESLELVERLEREYEEALAYMSHNTGSSLVLQRLGTSASATKSGGKTNKKNNSSENNKDSGNKDIQEGSGDEPLLDIDGLLEILQILTGLRGGSSRTSTNHYLMDNMWSSQSACICAVMPDCAATTANSDDCCRQQRTAPSRRSVQ